MRASERERERENAESEILNAAAKERNEKVRTSFRRWRRRSLSLFARYLCLLFPRDQLYFFFNLEFRSGIYRKMSISCFRLAKERETSSSLSLSPP